MTPDQLRDLADRLEPMAAAPGFVGLGVPAFCEWLRAQADAQPVARGVAEPKRDPFAPDELEQIIDDYVADYELSDGEVSRDLSDEDRFMLKDAIMGLLVDPAWDRAWGALIDEQARKQAEPKREPLSDERITKGEYVLATKFSDGDPGDHWGVGFYDRFENGRHYVVDRAGQQIRGSGFRRAGRITMEVGIWLLSAAKSLEASPPGTVNLWTMLTERAHGIGGSDAE